MTKKPLTPRTATNTPRFQSFLKILKPLFKFKPFQSHSNSTLKQDSVNGNVKDYPTGDFVFKPITGFNKFLVKLKMLTVDSSQRVEHGSVLKIVLRGQISDQFLPQFWDNLLKAAYDPRISAVYLHIDSLYCDWAKLDEIQRHILNFRKSGKFVVAYLPSIREKEYYIACACEEIFAPPSACVSLFGFTVKRTFIRGFYDLLGIEPQIERIGKYKSAGDQLTRKTMSEDHREMLTAILDNIYSNWVDKVSSARGKKRKDIEKCINEGVYEVDRLKEKGFITNIIYDDEVITRLRKSKRLQVKSNKYLPMVDFRKYSGVRKWTVGISDGKEKIAVIRASGTIHRVGGEGIVGEKFINEIHRVRASNKFKAAIIRIDSPGGDALASDLMWREIRLLAAKKPVVASMSDIATSGGYYVAMGADAIVAENLTLTGSIGVITKKFNYEKRHKKFGLNKEVISRGKYAELFEADHRSFRPHEAKLFAKRTQNVYKQFRDKAALSRSMTVEKMEEVAQGRVWTGKDAASHGLVDAIGGLSRAIAIAKLKANIPQDSEVIVVEISSPSSTLPGVLSNQGNYLVGADRTFKEPLQELAFSDEVQARMDETMFQNLDGYPSANPISALMNDYLNYM